MNIEFFNEPNTYFEKEDEFLCNSIKQAFCDLYNNDHYLINNLPDEPTEQNGNHHVCERSIVCRYAYYLQNKLLEDEKYASYNLDCEYNRNIYDIKTALINQEIKSIYPDLIVHRRGKTGNNQNNLLVMEFKTYWNRSIKSDIDKVKALVDQDGKYKYKYGLVVTIEKELSATKIQCIK